MTPSGSPTARASRRSRRSFASASASEGTRSSCRPRLDRRGAGASAARSRPIRSAGPALRRPGRPDAATRWGRPTATSSAASAAATTGPPTWSPARATPTTSPRLLELCAERRLAAIPFGGGTQRRRRRRAAGRSRLPRHGLGRPRPAQRRGRGRRGLARRPDPRRHPRPRPRGRPAASTASPCGTSRSRSSSRRSAVGSPPARAATSPRSQTHIDDLVESVTRDHPVGPVGEPSPAGLGSRTEPGPHAARLRGDPRRDHRGLGPGQAPARSQGLEGGPLRRLPQPAPRRCGRSPSRACTPRTAGCSIRSRRRPRAPATVRLPSWCSDSRAPSRRSITRWTWRSSAPPTTGAGQSPRARPARAAAAESWRSAFLDAPYLRDC